MLFTFLYLQRLHDLFSTLFSLVTPKCVSKTVPISLISHILLLLAHVVLSVEKSIMLLFPLTTRGHGIQPGKQHSNLKAPFPKQVVRGFLAMCFSEMRI